MSATAHTYDVGLRRRRALINKIALAMSLVAMAIGLAALVWILFDVVRLGISALSPTLFTLDTPAPGSPGGLRNAIVGSVILVALATLVGTPIGVLAGIYLAEYGARSWLAGATRFVNDILLSAPSIVLGLFVYAVFVTQTGGFSGWAGVIVLALLMIPVIVRTTENMLLLIPNTLREAAFALGCDKWKVIMYITLRAARSGVVTGILLAVARIAGETAPLLFTALSNQFFSVDLNAPVANLPVTIFKFAMSPYPDWVSLAWAGVFLITAGVLALNILARVFFRDDQKR
jgi:phosphate transport system permease protein